MSSFQSVRRPIDRGKAAAAAACSHLVSSGRIFYVVSLSVYLYLLH